MNLTFSYRKEKTASNLQINEQILHVFCLSNSDLVVSKRLPTNSSLAGEKKKGKFGMIYMMRELMNPNTDCSDYFQ